MLKKYSMRLVSAVFESAIRARRSYGIRRPDTPPEFPRSQPAPLRHRHLRSPQLSIQPQIVVHHPSRGEAFARPVVGSRPVEAY